METKIKLWLPVVIMALAIALSMRFVGIRCNSGRRVLCCLSPPKWEQNPPQAPAMLSPSVVIVIPPRPPPRNEILSNGREHKIRADWIPGESWSSLKGEDYCIVILQLHSNGSVSYPWVSAPAPRLNKFGVNDSIENVISHWRYYGNRAGTVAIKIDWKKSSVLIDTTGLTSGSFQILQVGDLVKEALQGLSVRGTWRCDEELIDEYQHFTVAGEAQ